MVTRQFVFATGRIVELELAADRSEIHALVRYETRVAEAWRTVRFVGVRFDQTREVVYVEQPPREEPRGRPENQPCPFGCDDEEKP